MKLRSIILPFISMRFFLILIALGCISCESIYSDQEDCPRGVSLRFVYDYNMEYANSFPAKVDCVSVYVFDEEGNYLTTYTESGAVLKDESYRMHIELGEGNYTFIVYGGLACNNKSFFIPDFQTRAEATHFDDLYVELNHDNFTSNKALHDLYFGRLDVYLVKDDYQEETVYLIKDTNNIRVMLQQMDGEEITEDQFVFEITDDNSYLDNANNVVSKGLVHYTPWAEGHSVVGSWDNHETNVNVVHAEMSTSRITTGTEPRLHVWHVEKEELIIDIPLKEYLLLLKSDLYSDMGAQEYLDRESEWSLIFFLDSGLRWVNTRVVINDWVVRINNTDL